MNNDELNSLFDKARNSESPISEKRVIQKFERSVLDTQNEKVLYQRRLVSVLAIAAAITAIVILFTEIIPSSRSIEIPTKDTFSVQNVSSKREAFIDQIIKTGKDPKSQIQILEPSSQPLLSERLIPTLKTDQSILEQLGFLFTSNEVLYEANVTNHGYLKYILSEKGKSLFLNDRHSTNVVFETSIYPLFISDMKGYQKTKFAFGSEGTLKSKQNIANSTIDDLVPIALPNPSKKDEYLAILWFESSDKLFDFLTQKNISSAIEMETTNKFDSVEEYNWNMKVLGNPFFRSLEFELSIPIATDIRIDLMSIEGSLIRTITSANRIHAGIHKFTEDLSELKPGIYHLILTTKEKRISKRILKT